jgi:hypothetical protein
MAAPGAGYRLVDRRCDMGRKPGERETKAITRTTIGFEATVPCGNCGAPSRHSHKRFRKCANGHVFVKKSDQ